MGREQADAGALQHLQVDAVQPRDLGVPGRAQLLEGQRRVADVPAIVLGRLEPLGEMGAVVHQLLGHAAADDAGAADPAVLGQPDLGAVRGGAPGAGDAAGAAADHEQVEVGHEALPAPAATGGTGPI